MAEVLLFYLAYFPFFLHFLIKKIFFNLFLSILDLCCYTHSFPDGTSGKDSLCQCRKCKTRSGWDGLHSFGLQSLFPFFYFWPHHAGCRASLTRMEPILPIVEAWSPNHWTSREVLLLFFFFFFLQCCAIMWRWGVRIANEHMSWDFHGGSGTKTLHSQWRGPGFDPW